MKNLKVGVIVGSLRKGSFSMSIARAVMDFLPAAYEAQVLSIGNLPMFNQDYDGEGRPPAEWTDFRATVGEMDAYLFVTPEYNRSVPAVLKNALDIASRPYGQNMWRGKPGAIISVSPGKPGGFGANHHLRQSASCLNIHMLQQPEAYIGGVTDSLDENGRVIDPSLNDFLQSFAGSFGRWAERMAKPKEG